MIGNNALSKAIARRWNRDRLTHPQMGQLRCIDSSLSLDELDAALDSAWANGVSPHLFLTTCHDDAANWPITDALAWSQRRSAGLQVPYRVCQRWMQNAIESDLMCRKGQASLITFVNLGGTFGLDSLEQEPLSHRESMKVTSESGALAGLTKAMRIEAWMRGYPDTSMLVIDGWPTDDCDAIVDGAWREWASPTYDEEVSVSGPSRRVVRAVHAPLPIAIHDALPVEDSSLITRGGTWLIAGGGRGITAAAAMLLAKRHDLKLHLLGTAPVPQIDAETRELAFADRAELRRMTMRRVQESGGNAVKHWREFEKAIEIDETLQKCRDQSIAATYHSVDVSDAQAVSQIVQSIVAIDGPIRGVIQGAGSGQDARFDRKRADKVDQCFRAKIDGTTALAHATMNQPLEWFVGFGSISGRFGANGHTDYSSANDMLAKMIGRLADQLPETHCVTFHWHAWGDIGMATKPEAKLALDMIGMEFMPAVEGLQHFLNELEYGGAEREVLITDRRYVRKFFPNGEWTPEHAKHVDAPETCLHLPMLDPLGKGTGSDGFAVTLDPSKDSFLNQHLVGGRPTLPMVMAIEMLAEAARCASGLSTEQFLKESNLVNVRAVAPLKCLTEDAFAIELVSSDSNGSEGRKSWKLISDLRRKDGRLVEAGRLHFQLEVQPKDQSSRVTSVPSFNKNEFPAKPELFRVDYPDADAAVHHGVALRCLRRWGFCTTESGDWLAFGEIVAPSPAHLTGEHRPVSGWVIPPAAMDAVLYAVGILAYHVDGRPSLPISMGELTVGRLPDPGEQLQVIVKIAKGDVDATGLTASAMLVGVNDDVLLQLTQYRIGWIG